MALQQLVANEQAREARLFQRQDLAAREYIECPFNGQVGWDRQMAVDLPRDGDCLERIQWKIEVGAAPQGYRWKHCWPHFFFRRLSLEIGGQRFWETNTQILQMEELIYGTRTATECIFNYGANERNERSQEPHEVFVEPLRLQDLLMDAKGLPMIRLAFHLVRLHVEIGSLADCLEPMEPMPPPLPGGLDAARYLLECTPVCLFTFLDTNERRRLAQAGETATVTKHMDYDSQVFEKDGNNRVRIRVDQNGICPAAYMWITDENDKELPRSIVREIEVRLNGRQTRCRLTGMQSRLGIRDQMPHATVENNKSTNFYYISFWPGRTGADGMEQGLNYSRFDMVDWNIVMYDHAPAHVKIHIAHRSQNSMKIMAGMAGLCYAYGGTRIRQAGVEVPRPLVVPAMGAQPRVHDVTALVFPDPDKEILIPADEPSCMITYREFEQGESVDQCGQCHKVFSTQAIMDWLKTRAHHQWKCVHCQGPYGVDTFVRGKARLAGGPAAVPVAQGGLLGRLQNAIFGGGYEAVHQD